MYAGDGTAADDTTLADSFTYPLAIGHEYVTTRVLEPSVISPYHDFAFCTSATQFAGLLTPTGNFPSNPACAISGDLTNSTYVTGSYTRTKSFKLIAASFPETSFRSFCVGYISGPKLIWDGDASFTKAATHSWTVGITTTVSRV